MRHETPRPNCFTVHFALETDDLGGDLGTILEAPGSGSTRLLQLSALARLGSARTRWPVGPAQQVSFREHPLSRDSLPHNTRASRYAVRVSRAEQGQPWALGRPRVLRVRPETTCPLRGATTTRLLLAVRFYDHHTRLASRPASGRRFVLHTSGSGHLSNTLFRSRRLAKIYVVVVPIRELLFGSGGCRGRAFGAVSDTACQGQGGANDGFSLRIEALNRPFR